MIQKCVLKIKKSKSEKSAKKKISARNDSYGTVLYKQIKDTKMTVVRPPSALQNESAETSILVKPHSITLFKTQRHLSTKLLSICSNLLRFWSNIAVVAKHNALNSTHKC